MSPSLKSFVVVVSSVIGFSGTLLAQESQGTGETVGQKIEHAAETVGDKLEATTESLGERAESAGEYLDDAAITALIKAEILGDPMLKVFQINVTTTDGVVNLSGAVDSQESIDRALAIARNNRSVKSVENGLVVKSVR